MFRSSAPPATPRSPPTARRPCVAASLSIGQRRQPVLPCTVVTFPFMLFVVFIVLVFLVVIVLVVFLLLSIIIIIIIFLVVLVILVLIAFLISSFCCGTACPNGQKSLPEKTPL
eukprot:NODE_652_length_1271_cov_111.716039_g516_i0.p3 GENE.NODE_652_length_1271_cov_111.716039_g516_i0~~NODE_652_length_1271_cov_111.716039_g516_i0.p3  ORF type:complete len:114 (+),score=30.18 NODE_652_length_1271_cov_111.716039_g516_i0:542-883(+)